MKKRSEPPPDWESQRMKIIGLGESSIRKSYYPELQQYIHELEKKNEDLNAAYEEQTAVEEELRQQIDETAAKEQELRRSEERFRLLIESSPIAIALARDGRIIYVNPAFCHMTGWDRPEDLAGRSMLDLVAPECRERIAGYIRARSSGEPADTTYEATGIRRDNSRFTYEVTVALIRLPEGDVTLAFFTDTTEKKRIETALIKSGERLNRAELVAGIGHWEFHMDQGFVEASDGARAIYGLNGERWTLSEVQKLPLPEYRAMLDDALRALIEENKPYDVEFRIRRQDNRIVDLHSIGEYDPKARIVFGVIQDITVHKRAEAIVRESEKKYRNIVETSPDIIWEIDTEGRFTYLSPRIRDLLGYPAESLTGKPFISVLTPDQVAPAGAAFQDQLRNGTDMITIEVVARHADGRCLDLEIRSAPATDDRGQLKGFRGITRDISDRKKADARLRESEERFRNISEYTPLGMHVYQIRNDGALILAGANPAADRIFSIDHAGRIGRPLEEIFPKVKKTPLPSIYREVASTGIPWQSDELTYKDEDIERSFAVYAFRISPQTVVAMFRDISESRRAAFSLDQARKKLNLLNIVTFQDIQNAAFSLSAYHVLINQLQPEKKLAAFLEKESVLIGRIISALNFAKNFQELGMHPPRWQNVSQTFLFAISHLDFLTISHTLDTGSLEVYADPLFEMVFFNLMENVLRHGSGADAVRLWYREDDGLILFVEDNGAGIPQEEKHMIFDRGYGKDAGLGLFLVREILSITEITIRETGVHGKGCRFEIHVPKGTYRIPAPQGSPAPSSGTGPRRTG